MAQVAVTIAGRVYRVACDEGEEEHLDELARTVDGKIKSMRQRFGEIGDQRLTVMAAITLADELAEERQRATALQAELAELKAKSTQGSSRNDEWADRVAQSLNEAALRIERMTHELNGSGRSE
ncbi:cell division protein ZapA [Methylocapsa acidiphila]|uniref:cell division protein ZapA n=1 Tax=Methylocapsa acidiphila TaxID=133552 RepID=UPI000411109E|nr:cell division protein ZapA [Methylocapsa acidiphila]